jgi:cytochrome c oxidase cbb3-type subunit 2
MNPGPFIFLASFFMMAVSWLGFVLVPQLQIGRQQQVEAQETSALYPTMRPGLARQGEQVYRANGCFYCHTEQVRPKGFGSDVERGWGGRPGEVQSVAQDYLYDKPVMLGSQRVGPDLANIGHRQTNEMVLLAHIYDPQSTMPKSVMPPYRYLFNKHTLKPGEKKSADALEFVKVGPNEEVIPTDDARALAAYLLSLHSEAILFETPPPPRPKTNNAAAASGTNAPAATNAPGATNVPATNATTTNK